MTGKKQDSSDGGDDTFAEQNTSRGGNKEGLGPDYEKNQSPMNDPKDFDNSKTSW